MSKEFTTQWLIDREARHAKQMQPPIGEPVDDEGELHGQIMAMCKSNMWIALHSAWGKKTGRLPGEMDFTVIMSDGAICFCECKKKKEKLTVEQAGVEAWLTKLGHKLYTVRNIEEFVNACHHELAAQQRLNHLEVIHKI